MSVLRNLNAAVPLNSIVNRPALPRISSLRGLIESPNQMPEYFASGPACGPSVVMGIAQATVGSGQRCRASRLRVAGLARRDKQAARHGLPVILECIPRRDEIGWSCPHKTTQAIAAVHADGSKRDSTGIGGGGSRPTLIHSQGEPQGPQRRPPRPTRSCPSPGPRWRDRPPQHQGRQGPWPVSRSRGHPLPVLLSGERGLSCLPHGYPTL